MDAVVAFSSAIKKRVMTELEEKLNFSGQLASKQGFNRQLPDVAILLFSVIVNGALS
jgi:hypothetical protein